MSLVATGHIITKHGIIAIQGSPEALAAAGRQIADDVLSGVSQTGNEAMSALELADLANGSIQVAQSKDPALESIKVIGSTAAGTAAGVAATPFLTPLGGAVFGFFVGKVYDWMFDRAVELDPNPYTGGPWTPILLSPEEVPTVVNSDWQEAKTPPRRDPLAIDLDGDGIETTGTGIAPVQFDHDGDGTRTGTGWLAPDDAWLVLDRNGNGAIDSGVELFGVDTPVGAGPTAADGFAALRALDATQDGRFDAIDPAYGQVQLWQDLNQDGATQPGELQSLASRGITAIALTPTAGTTDLGNGNTLAGTATVAHASGASTGIAGLHLSAGNLNLADNPFYRTYPDTVPLSDAARALPDMRGSGWARDLREAMSLGSPESHALGAAVSAMAAAPTRDQQLAAADGVLQAWAESTGRLTPAQDQRPLSITVVSQSPGQRTLRYTVAEPGQWASAYARLEFPSDAYAAVIRGIGRHSSHVLTASGAELLRRMTVLEVFNGSRFVDIMRVEGAAPFDWPGAGGPIPTSSAPAAPAPADPAAGVPPFGGSGAGTPPFGSGAGAPPFGSGFGTGFGGSGSGGSAVAAPGFSVSAADPGAEPGSSGGIADPVGRIRVPLTERQIAFINSAYEHLRDSVHAAVATQTRLKPYTDQIALAMEGDAVKLDFSAMEAALLARGRTDPYNAVADLLDLRRFEGPTLAPLGWDTDASLAALLGGIAMTPQIQGLLDADAAPAGTPPLIAAIAAATASVPDSPAADGSTVTASGAATIAGGTGPSWKFDSLPPVVETFPEPAAASHAEAAFATRPIETTVDLLVQAAAAMPPATSNGLPVPPESHRTPWFPDLAIGA